MFRTLYAKLALALLILITLIGLGYGLFTLYSSQLFIQELNQRFNRDLARKLLVDENILDNDMLEQDVIKSIFKRYMHINPAIEIYLLDAEGHILAFEAPEMKKIRDQVNLEPIRRFLSGDMAYPILGDDPRSMARQKVFSAAAYPWKGEPRQYLYVVLAGEDYDTAEALLQESYYLQLTLSGVAALMIFGLFSALYIFNLLTRRLKHLSIEMQSFRASDFQSRHPYRSNRGIVDGDEIDRLGGTYNEMAERIINQMQSLQEKDSLRRNLIANVSHDLRTPLAALRGYLETLSLKGEELSIDDQRNYLDVAYRHSERLTNLIADLFELSKLDAREEMPNREPISLLELAHDVVQKFQLRAEQEGIDLKCTTVKNMPAVEADIGMVERVLENLLVNALNHTEEGGTIRVWLEEEGGLQYLNIANSGAGILKGDLPHLFERFYQPPENRGGSGSGLGLAIVQRILQLHDSTIKVKSISGVETRFWFSLPSVSV